VDLQHQGANDEFWYACVPTNLAGELQSCIGTAFREGQLSIDGQPAGVVSIFPWIFTGGVDPYFWRPIPAPQALNFIPYRVDVTPFAGVVSDGNPHRFAIKVTNNSRYFSTTATLLLYLDHGSKQVTGAVTKNTRGEDSRAIKTRMSWPLEMELSVNFDKGGNFTTQVGRVKQAYNRSDSDGEPGSVVSNSGEWADTYPTREGQSGSQRYFS